MKLVDKNSDSSETVGHVSKLLLSMTLSER